MNKCILSAGLKSDFSTNPGETICEHIKSGINKAVRFDISVGFLPFGEPSETIHIILCSKCAQEILSAHFTNKKIKNWVVNNTELYFHIRDNYT